VSRKAGLYNEAVRKLGDAQAALCDREVTEQTIPELTKVCTREWQDAQGRKAEALPSWSKWRRSENGSSAAFDALTRLAGKPCPEAAARPPPEMWMRRYETRSTK